jgi:predicted nuclease of restriction endonuclease-like (RecB) superfamily
MTTALTHYAGLLRDIKARVQQAQTKAILSANRQMIELYWDVGRLIHKQQKTEGWGAGVIPRLAIDLKNELPEIKGFSTRNLGRMIRFYVAYPALKPILPQPVAKPLAAETEPQRVDQGVLEPDQRAEATALSLQIPWSQNFILIEKIKDLPTRLWYMQQTLFQGWSRNVLSLMIKSRAHERQGAATTNFDQILPSPQSDLAQQALKDPYIFDFLTLDEPFRERELETGLVRHLESFLLELGVGFAFVGRQHKLTLGDDDFYLDLLFYHLRLRCFVVVELKVGAFKPDYAGKMNVYLNLVDDTLRHEQDKPTIGLILCQDKKQVLAEYALRGMDKPIGVSEYELTRALPKALESALPTIEEIEAELGGSDDPVSSGEDP